MRIHDSDEPFVPPVYLYFAESCITGREKYCAIHHGVKSLVIGLFLFLAKKNERGGEEGLL